MPIRAVSREPDDSFISFIIGEEDESRSRGQKDEAITSWHYGVTVA